MGRKGEAAVRSAQDRFSNDWKKYDQDNNKSGIESLFLRP